MDRITWQKCVFSKLMCVCDGDHAVESLQIFVFVSNLHHHHHHKYLNAWNTLYMYTFCAIVLMTQTILFFCKVQGCTSQINYISTRNLRPSSCFLLTFESSS